MKKVKPNVGRTVVSLDIFLLIFQIYQMFSSVNPLILCSALRFFDYRHNLGMLIFQVNCSWNLEISNKFTIR